MASAVSNQFSAMSQEDHRIEDDISDEEILEAIKNSMKDQQVWSFFLFFVTINRKKVQISAVLSV